MFISRRLFRGYLCSNPCFMLSCLVEVAFLDAVYGAREPVCSDISGHLEVRFAMDRHHCSWRMIKNRVLLEASAGVEGPRSLGFGS
ncbi:hypothetical protein BJX65DRAFT_6262 [Aspergillus insuetus]